MLACSTGRFAADALIEACVATGSLALAGAPVDGPSIGMLAP